MSRELTELSDQIDAQFDIADIDYSNVVDAVLSWFGPNPNPSSKEKGF